MLTDTQSQEIRAEYQPGAWQLLVHFTLTGALTGWALSQWLDYMDSGVRHWVWVACLAAIIVGTTSYWLISEAGNRTRAAAIALALAVLWGLLSGHYQYRVGPSDSWRNAFPPGLLNAGCLFVFCVIAIPYIRLWLGNRAPGNQAIWYPRLFRYGWAQFVVMLIGSAFAALTLLLLLLLVALFSIIGIDLKNQLLTQQVLMPLYAASLATAIGVTRERENWIQGLGQIILILLRLLMPVHLFVMGAFLIAVVISGIESVDTSLGVAGVMLSAVLFALTFVSATVGNTDQSIAPRSRAVACRALAFLVFPLTTLAAYALWLRIDAYGLTQERLLAAILIGISFFYACGYAIASIKPSFERTLQLANITASLACAVVCIVLMTPAVNLPRLAVDSQVNRILSKNTDRSSIDLGFLAYESGPYGLKALERIKASDTSDNADLQYHLSKLEESDSPYDYYQTVNPQVTPFPISILNQGKLQVILRKGTKITQFDDDEGYLQAITDKHISTEQKLDDLFNNLIYNPTFSISCQVVENSIAKFTDSSCLLLISDQTGFDNYGWVALFAVQIDDTYLQFNWYVFDTEANHASWIPLNNDMNPERSSIAVPASEANQFMDELRSGEIPLVNVSVKALSIGDQWIVPDTVQKSSLPFSPDTEVPEN